MSVVVETSHVFFMCCVVLCRCLSVLFKYAHDRIVCFFMSVLQKAVCYVLLHVL